MAWDNQEFAAVFNALYPNLCRFLECLLRESSSAQDIAQETFVRLYRKGNPNMPGNEARFWTYRVARNLALNELNKTRTRNRLAENAQTVHNLRIPHPGEEYEQSETLQILRRLLESLPEHQRAALLLREQQEMSYAEISGVLGVTESKVKVDIHRARLALREKWRAICQDGANAASQRKVL